MFKNLFLGLILIVLFMVIVFITKDNSFTIPLILLMYYVVGIYSKNYKQIFTILIPFLLVWIYHLLFMKDSLKSIVILYLIFIPIVSIIGFHSKNKRFLLKIALPFLFIPFGLYFYPNWFEFYENYGARVNKKSPKIELLTENDTIIRLDTIKGKVIVLDFWNTSCGICFEKFPYVEEIKNDFKENKNVDIYAVNIQSTRDTLNEGKALFCKKGVNIKSLYAKNSDVSDSLGVNRFPTLVIIKNGRIRYNGRLIVKENIIVYNLKNEINRLLEEK